MSKLNLDAVRKLIRTEEDAAVLQEKLKAMIEEAHPAPVFRAGETMPMHEFLSRYQKKICGGVVPQFYSVAVRVLSSEPQALSFEIVGAKDIFPLPAPSDDR